jgi:hypothetical protein
MKSKFTNKENTDAALALMLILILLKIFLHFEIKEIWLVIILFFALAIPIAFYPFTFIWLNFSHLLGQLMSKVLLILVFVIFVIPVALFRKILGRDKLQLKQFKKTDNSVFITRNHHFSKNDMQSPY